MYLWMIPCLLYHIPGMNNCSWVNSKNDLLVTATVSPATLPLFAKITQIYHSEPVVGDICYNLFTVLSGWLKLRCDFLIVSWCCVDVCTVHKQFGNTR